jgi:hypothetical protein
MHSENSFLIVRKFISDFCGISDLNSIKPDKTLSGLGLYGDDKLEFMESFFNTFEIENTNFDWGKYIEPERGFISLEGFFRFIFGKPNEKKEFEITVGQLIVAFDKKAW